MRRDEQTTATPQAAEVDPPRSFDLGPADVDPADLDPGDLDAIAPSADEELSETQAAQRAHGGSMAPQWVDPTGKPTEQARG